MELFPIEIRPPFQPPSEDAKLVLLADGGIHFDGADLRRHPVAVRALCQGAPRPPRERPFRARGEPLPLPARTRRAGALPPARPAPLPPAAGALRPGERAEVVHTELGNLFLCVDADIYHPQVLRTAALKGADAVLSVRASTRRRTPRPRSLHCLERRAEQQRLCRELRGGRRGGLLPAPSPARGTDTWCGAPTRCPCGSRSTWSGSTRSAPVRADGTDQPGARGELRRRTGEVAACGKRFWGC